MYLRLLSNRSLRDPAALVSALLMEMSAGCTGDGLGLDPPLKRGSQSDPLERSQRSRQGASEGWMLPQTLALKMISFLSSKSQTLTVPNKITFIDYRINPLQWAEVCLPHVEPVRGDRVPEEVVGALLLDR